MRGGVRPVGAPLVAGQVDLVHDAVDDDPGGRERGERAGLRAHAHHQGHQERRNARARGDRHGHRREHRGGGDVAGSERRDPEAEQEEGDRNEAGVAAAQADRSVRDLIERAVQLGLGEQQRDADERQEQLDRKAGEDVLEPHPAEVDADDPGERHRQDADVEPREAADDDRDEQGAEGQPRQ